MSVYLNGLLSDLPQIDNIHYVYFIAFKGTRGVFCNF